MFGDFVFLDFLLRDLFGCCFSTGGFLLVLVKKLRAFGVVVVGELGFAETGFQCMFAEIFLFLFLFFFSNGLVSYFVIWVLGTV